MTQTAVAALSRVLSAVVETIEASPEGAPDGVIFAALQTQGCTLQQWTEIRDTLIKIGKVEKRGDLLFPVK